MRLVIDMQAAQGISRRRGIGRLSTELALAMARAAGRHEPIILLNEALPNAHELDARFGAILPRGNIRGWRGLADAGALHGEPARARRLASETIRAHVIAGIAPDLLHVASVMEGANDDVIAAWPASLLRPPQATTFYDAIPLIRRETYLDAPGDEDRRAWYLRHAQEVRESDALLAISRSARAEAIEHVGVAPDRVHVIGAGYDQALFAPPRMPPSARRAVLSRHGLPGSYILFVGAGDPRKNEAGLLRAYARLPEAVRRAHVLAIVGAGNEAALRAEAEALGVPPRDLALIGYLPDDDLPVVYAGCALFVMPSLHEGFGLTALEAMACGAPVIASGTSSLPEVVGDGEALFDPCDPASIAERIEAALCNTALRERLIARGLRRARDFSWANAAHRAWSAMEATLDTRRMRGVASSTIMGTTPRAEAPRQKPRLACVAPLPPEPSGIADYTRDLLPELAAYYDITLVTHCGETGDETLRALFPMLSEDAFMQAGDRFDRILYQLGNSPMHLSAVDRLLPAHPGVAVLHDAFMSELPLAALARPAGMPVLARALFDSEGWAALRALADDAPESAARQFPCSLSVFRHALAVIQHSLHAKAIVAEAYGPRIAGSVRIVPFARARWASLGRAAARARLGVVADAAIIATFGLVGPMKRPLDVLAVWMRAFAAQPDARLVYVGAAAMDAADAIRSHAAAHGLGDRVDVTGRVDEETYRLWLDAADMALQLRRGSRGETSGAIIDAMSVGLPVVANAHGAAAELPGDAVLLLPDGAEVPQIAAAVAALWRDLPRRAAVGRRASDYARDAFAPRRAAAFYRAAIESAYTAGIPALLRAATPCLPEADAPNAARALAGSFAIPGPRRLLLDVAALGARGTDDAPARLDTIALKLLLDPGAGWRGEAVRLDPAGMTLLRTAAASFLGLPSIGIVDQGSVGSPDDVLVLFATSITPEVAPAISRLRRAGVTVVAVGATDAIIPLATAVDAVITSADAPADDDALLSLLKAGGVGPVQSTRDAAD